jgi:transposase-like protein
MASAPKTLQEAILYFSDPKNTIDHLVARRWPNGVFCPTCGSKDVKFLEKRNVWQCKNKHARKQFSVKVGTIFEDSPISLDKWFAAMWMLATCRNGVSSYEVHRALGITQKSAWFMMHRIRRAMQTGSFLKQLEGDVEADETFIGGKARNMHRMTWHRRITGSASKDKSVVLGILERGGEVRTKVVATRKKKELQAEVKKHVQAGSALYTDSLHSYDGLEAGFEHQVIDHAVGYVDGKIHTNGLENFWSVLKRGINGTYISIEPFHLFRYLDEQAFRFNNRKDENGEPLGDAQRFSRALGQVGGKRLTYKALTGKLRAEETR